MNLDTAMNSILITLQAHDPDLSACFGPGDDSIIILRRGKATGLSIRCQLKGLSVFRLVRHHRDQVQCVSWVERIAGRAQAKAITRLAIRELEKESA